MLDEILEELEGEGWNVSVEDESSLSEEESADYYD